MLIHQLPDGTRITARQARKLKQAQAEATFHKLALLRLQGFMNEHKCDADKAFDMLKQEVMRDEQQIPAPRRGTYRAAWLSFERKVQQAKHSTKH